MVELIVVLTILAILAALLIPALTGYIRKAKRINNLGRITNAALNAVQRNPNDKTEINTSSRRIARQVLSYLDSADKSNAQYLFTAPSEKKYMGYYI